MFNIVLILIIQLLKKITTISLLGLFVLLGIAANTKQPAQFKNLKVLPQNISDKQLDSVMNAFTKALKVDCEFCHAKPKDFTGLQTNNGDLDFSLDNSMKDQARKMMRMSIDVNRKYFAEDTVGKADYQLNAVSCNTCHRGNPFPVYE